MAAGVFVASLKAFLAPQHKIPIIAAAHRAPIGPRWTPKGWEKPARLITVTTRREQPFTDARSLRGTLFGIGVVDNYTITQPPPPPPFIQLQLETGTLVRPLEILVNSGR